MGACRAGRQLGAGARSRSALFQGPLGKPGLPGMPGADGPPVSTRWPLPVRPREGWAGLRPPRGGCHSPPAPEAAGPLRPGWARSPVCPWGGDCRSGDVGTQLAASLGGGAGAGGPVSRVWKEEAYVSVFWGSRAEEGVSWSRATWGAAVAPAVLPGIARWQVVRGARGRTRQPRVGVTVHLVPHPLWKALVGFFSFSFFLSGTFTGVSGVIMGHGVFGASWRCAELSQGVRSAVSGELSRPRGSHVAGERGWAAGRRCPIWPGAAGAGPPSPRAPAPLPGVR